MKSVVRQASKVVFAGLDVFARRLDGPLILIYHQVGGGSGLEMEVEPGTFRRHLDWIADHLEVKHLDTAIADGDGVVLTFDDGYCSLYEVAYPLLRERGMPFTLYLTTDPVESGRPMRDHPGADPLTWDHVREMRDSGLLTLGAHTHTHPDFRHLDVPDIEQEVDRSDELIEERTGIRPRHFAYPWGYWAESAHHVVGTRYEYSALGSPLPWHRSATPDLLYRIPVQLSDGFVWFTRRIRSGLLYEEWLRRRLRGYRGP